MSKTPGVVPVLGWLPHYQGDWLRRDVGAGVTLAAYAVPAALAYAGLAGLPPQTGLYCYLLAGVAYAIFGTSRQAAIGPTSAISILVGATLGGLAVGDASHYLALAGLTAIVVGLVSLAAWALQLGEIVHFISDTVLTGFKAGVALQIASTQLPKLLGVRAAGDGFFGRVGYLTAHLGDTHLLTLIVGAGGMLLLIEGERRFPRRPTILGVVVLSIVLSQVLRLQSAGVEVLGIVPGGFPALGLPLVALDDFGTVLPLALACFLLSYIESVSVVRTFGLRHDYPVSPGQELLALAAANAAAGLGQGFPVAAGMSQSAVNDKGGAQTPVALIVASGVMALVVMFFTGLFRALPSAILAGVVLVAVRGLINLEELQHFYRVSRPDFLIAMLALVGVLIFGVLQGVLLAAIMSLLLVIRRASRPNTAVLGRIPGTLQFGDLQRHESAERVPGVVVYRVYGGIVYFNVEHVETELQRLLQSEPGPIGRIVFDLSSSPLIDLAGVRMLASLHDRMTQRGIVFQVAEAHGQVRDFLRAEGVTQRKSLADPSRSVAAICEL